MFSPSDACITVWRTYCENHCLLKDHRSVSKRMSHGKPWEDYQGKRQGCPCLKLIVKLAKFVLCYLFPQLSTNKCAVPTICPL